MHTDNPRFGVLALASDAPSCPEFPTALAAPAHPLHRITNFFAEIVHDIHKLLAARYFRSALKVYDSAQPVCGLRRTVYKRRTIADAGVQRYTKRPMDIFPSMNLKKMITLPEDQQLMPENEPEKAVKIS